MRVLVACEFSGIVREAFAAKGHDAWSCDLLPTEIPGQHYEGDVTDILQDGWDLVIAHPPCTYLCAPGVCWNTRRPERWNETYLARDFVQHLWDANTERVVIENPAGWLNKNWMRPSQSIQPWMFGHEATKLTCLWIRGLPNLRPTKVVGRGEFYLLKNGDRMSKWSHKRSSTKQRGRATVASRTFTGIAAAMADQWG